MKRNISDLVKLCHYLLHFLSFIGLLLLCYVLYMSEAIKESEREAMTVTKRSKPIEIEPPTITVCPNTGFKPSISKLYNLSTSFRDILISRGWPKKGKKELNMLHKEMLRNYTRSLCMMMVSPLIFGDLI